MSAIMRRSFLQKAIDYSLAAIAGASVVSSLAAGCGKGHSQDTPSPERIVAKQAVEQGIEGKVLALMQPLAGRDIEGLTLRKDEAYADGYYREFMTSGMAKIGNDLIDAALSGYSLAIMKKGNEIELAVMYVGKREMAALGITRDRDNVITILMQYDPLGNGPGRKTAKYIIKGSLAVKIWEENGLKEEPVDPKNLSGFSALLEKCHAKYMDKR